MAKNIPFIPKNSGINLSAPTVGIDLKDFDFTDYTYPIDLAGNAGLNHFVTFYIYENSQSSFVGKNSLSGSSLTPKNPIASIISSSGTFDQNSQINQNSIKDAANSAITGATGAAKQLFSNKKTKMAISLYMPPQIATTYSADWSKEDLGIIGSGVDQIKNAWNNGSGKSWTESRDARNQNIADLIKTGVMGMVGNAALALSAVSQTAISSIASAQLGIAINPHAEVIFRGMSFRGFQFEFKFTPRTEDEAIVCDNIIQAFKFYAAPEVNFAGLSGPFFLFPAEFDIQFWSNGKPNDYLNKISTCALTNISVNYTANGMFTAIKPVSNRINGVTVETNLILQFAELELITKQRVLEGY